MSFASLGLTPELLRAVEAEGYTEPTPVQAEAIPFILDRRDVLAGAQTGTGKTAAFVLPILQLLNGERPRTRHPIGPRPKGATGLPIRCLVLTPTRELALQAEEFVRVYGRQQPVRSTTIYGGVGYDAQIKAIQGGPEIVVATPGRLLDIAGQGKIDLRTVEILVLDEADRMLDMGFIRDIRRILALLPPVRQNLMFSATFADDVRSLAATFLHNPAEVQVARRNAPIELVRQVVHPVDRSRKRELLAELILSGRIEQALVFTRTKHGANRLAEQLDDDGINVAAIHGNKSQGQRIKALDDFKEGRVAILVATEIAARGLDIDGLPHVVNYELPTVPEDYVHRIGRTGRAGMEGDAISLVSAEEADQLAEIEAVLRKPIPRQVVPGFEPLRGLRAEPARRSEHEARRRPAPAPHRQPAPRRESAPWREPVGAGPRRVEPARGEARRPARPYTGEPRRTVAPAARRHALPTPGAHDERRTSSAPLPQRAPQTATQGTPRFWSLPGERFARVPNE